MKTFICWSGPTSNAVAESLRDWLKKVIQAAEPFISEDIDKGEAWMTRLAAELAQTEFAIICLTPDNLGSPWLHFETAAIWKGLDRTRVVPYLHLVDKADLKYPLAHFQGAYATKDETLALLKSMNGQLEHPLAAGDLEDSFEMWWPKLEEALDGIKPSLKKRPAEPSRTAEDMQREILLAVRDLSSRVERVERLGRQSWPDAARRPPSRAVLSGTVLDCEPLVGSGGEGTAMRVLVDVDELNEPLRYVVPPKVVGTCGGFEVGSRIKFLAGAPGEGNRVSVIRRLAVLSDADGIQEELGGSLQT